MGLSISLLGSFQVTLHREPVTAFGSDKVRALLAYLAGEAERPIAARSWQGKGR
jgi:DNA-binding SARP family transcriptional activator